MNNNIMRPYAQIDYKTSIEISNNGHSDIDIFVGKVSLNLSINIIIIYSITIIQIFHSVADM